MKYSIIILVLANLIGCATMTKSRNEYSKDTRVYKFAKLNRYVLIVSHEPNLYVQLRDLSTNRLIQDLVLSSRYMDPSHDILDIVLDDQPEILIKTRGGGTGFHVTSLKIYAIIKDRIAEIGDFPLDLYSAYADTEEHIVGDVSFPEKNQALYAFTREDSANGQTQKTNDRELYRFDTHKQKFKKIPQQVASSNR